MEKKFDPQEKVENDAPGAARMQRSWIWKTEYCNPAKETTNYILGGSEQTCA